VPTAFSPYPVKAMPDAGQLRLRRALAVVATWGLLAVLVTITADLPAGAPDASAQTGGTTTTRGGSATTPRATDNVRPGRVAYVTSAGEVVVAKSDGSDPVVIGTGAVANGMGLAPISWDPFGASIAYVRNDGALVMAPVDGGEARVVATDAAVPSSATDQLLSFDVLGQTLSYIRQTAPGRYRAQVVGVGSLTGTTAPVGDVDRMPVSLQWSPLDAYLLYVSSDATTGGDTNLGFALPGGAIVRSSVQLIDPTYSADGSNLYGILRGYGVDQLVQLDIDDFSVKVLLERKHICHPAVSPKGDRIVFGSGPDASCSEVWLSAADGSNPKRIYERVGSNVVFNAGVFSWSLDGSVISHPSCRMLTSGPSCGSDGYWDLDPGGGRATQRVGANVRREIRPQLKSVKVRFDVTGPFTYQRTMVISSDAAGDVLNQERSTSISVTAKDERNTSRSFSLDTVGIPGQRYTAGALRIVDPDRKVDRTVTILATAIITGYRFAAIRGIWLDTSSMPFTSGRVDVTINR